MKLSVAALIFTTLAVGALAGPLDGAVYSDDDRYHPSFPEEPIKPNARNAQQEQTIAYWRDNAKRTVESIVNRKQNKNVAKNVIMFLGDGMSISTVAMARVYAGGEEKSLSFEEFPYIGMSKTYCVDYQVPDSACTATAYLTGVKGNYETIGVNAKVPSYDCKAELDKSTHTHSIAKWAMDAGKDAGLRARLAPVEVTNPSAEARKGRSSSSDSPRSTHKRRITPPPTGPGPASGMKGRHLRRRFSLQPSFMKDDSTEDKPKREK
ncbi:alkaline phosphatase [Culex quinquefasciatus]|uniref:Alkaline phosphatase n=1 Tax=Culex quinquefasciatus TaxID=7176 RepID=B0W2L2_CULQU|nr:alkaline phosphatase [Culex quinquefasciatus]|eukprot:XP_001842931.1 alkaline phosphatase [Culex quinquefasciatus]